jgi:hypothetical protein
MKKIIYSILGISLLTIMSCGPNAEQKAAAEKVKMDSVAKATMDNIKQTEEAQKSKEEDEANQEALKNQLIEMKAQLAGEQTKMDDIKKFHLGRLDSEKEQQVASQTAVIEKLNNDINDIQKQIK